MQPLEQQLGQAFQLLQAGNATAARDIAQSVCRAAPKSPDAHHLLALCNKTLGKADDASKSFRKAIQLAPRNAQIITNYANFLLAIGRAGDAIKHYKNACKLAPDFLNAFMGLGSAATAAGDAQLAIEAYKYVTEKQPDASGAWQGLGSAYRLTDQLDSAVWASQKAIEIDPRNAPAWLNLGVLNRLLGNLETALENLKSAQDAGFQGPELIDAVASVHLDLGNIEESMQGFRKLTSEFPYYLPGHDALARVRWEYESDVDPLDEIFEATAQQPDNIPLQLKHIGLLIEGKRHEEALTRIAEVRARSSSPALDASEALAHEELLHFDEAEACYRRAIKAMPNEPEVHIAYGRLLLRSHRPDEAEKYLRKSVELDPDNQMGWGFLGTSWRMMDDPREDWLHRYDRFVEPLQVEPPGEYASREEFCEALKEALLPMHHAYQEPIDQSLKNGTQTSGHLFGHPEGVIKQARDAIADAIAKYQANLPIDDEHPFLRRSSPNFRFQGAWSVRLFSSGFHINHVHGKGWLSSAFYVSLPPSVGADDNDQSGWIQFGQPPLDLGLDVEPRRYIKPQVGYIAVFPSYTWHGTIPFEDEHPRMTMAYDVVPRT